ncbi:MAG: 2-oxoglutarate dehydrogenase E1 component [Betaproteobacteria bacterium]|nr:2-oxoglutarate dehydrogenase E1 component [Betaproteobacteria bacterium]
MMKDLMSGSYLSGGNAAYIDELYEAYLQGQESLAPEWKRYFDQIQVLPGPRDVPHEPVRELIARIARERTSGGRSNLAPAELAELGRKQAAVFQLISSYRFLGVRHAALDPLKRLERPNVPELDPAHHGLTEADLDRVFDTGTLVGAQQATLRDILQALRETYCGSIGLEYMYITDTAQKKWIQQRFEGMRSRISLSPDAKRHVLERLTAAEVLEKYLHTRFVGQKRFSLEGGETLIPMLDNLLQRAGENGVQELVIGMAHRGRLNVLVNTLGKIPEDLFSEFEGKKAGELPAGDVKYHQGFSSDVMTMGGPMHVTLAFNPSHLEIVNPVVEGSVRARQHRRRDREGRQVLPVLIHGDAAFAGQGVVMETLNLSQTRGYGTGGTVHIIVNNQIGFTTSDPRDMRSTIYCTDVAKMVEAPVIHVNSDDPEAVMMAIEAALDFRVEFQRDIVVDLVCFRKLGHNEQDEPMVTQPLMYKIISQHPGTRKLYADRLFAEGVVKEGEADRMIAEFRSALDAGQHTNKSIIYDYRPPFAVDWTIYNGKKWNDGISTGMSLEDLTHLSERLTTVPAHFKLHSRVDKVIADRRQMGLGKLPLDWGMAENLAYASLLKQGYGVRLSGQDSGRGTFFHRHAVLHDQNRERWDAGTYVPLQNIAENQPDFVVIDSTLSEEAVLGFEYGYATASPSELVVWEAQFGDFANGAQVVIDQFIASGEVKWGRLCGLVLMLPHGYEGQGPEHSSARLERFLQLCADYNMQVVVPSTPAQMYHVLCRQMLRPYRKPMVIMSPKSMLRHKESVSTLEELSRGRFQPVIPETDALDPAGVKQIVFCSGKVYYDVVAARRERGIRDIAVVRIEQLYPFPHEDFAAEIARYPNAAEVVWCQEEPGNQGAWHRIQHYLVRHMRPEQKLKYALRPSSASPAGGFVALHNQRQKAVVDAALKLGG